MEQAKAFVEGWVKKEAFRKGQEAMRERCLDIAITRRGSEIVDAIRALEVEDGKHS